VTAPAPAAGASLQEVNQRFYDRLWRGAKLVPPERFNTWPLVQTLLTHAPRRLEVAPGLRPRLPVAGTQFVDISEPALAKLLERGASVQRAPVTELPFADHAFDLVCALDIVEHVEDDDRALSELARVAAPGAVLLLSVPLHPAQWTDFDAMVGHCRRYEPGHILSKLAALGFTVEQSAAFGMKPKHPRLVQLGMWLLARYRNTAMWWYNHVIMPLGVRFQKKLELQPGVMPLGEVAEVFLVCRKA
jgi:SAM-dependent methyltransferase